VNVSGLTGVTSIGLGDSHACAVSGGMVWCWGYNEDGETGDGTTRNNRLTPVQTLP
jgi:serine/threonine-protein kinase